MGISEEGGGGLLGRGSFGPYSELRSFALVPFFLGEGSSGRGKYWDTPLTLFRCELAEIEGATCTPEGRVREGGEVVEAPHFAVTPARAGVAFR